MCGSWHTLSNTNSYWQLHHIFIDGWVSFNQEHGFPFTLLITFHHCSSRAFVPPCKVQYFLGRNETSRCESVGVLLWQVVQIHCNVQISVWYRIKVYVYGIFGILTSWEHQTQPQLLLAIIKYLLKKQQQQKTWQYHIKEWNCCLFPSDYKSEPIGGNAIIHNVHSNITFGNHV